MTTPITTQGWCSQCGARLDPAARYCATCGHATSPVVDHPTVMPASSGSGSRPGRVNVPLIVGMLIAVLAAGAGAVLVMGRGSGNAEPARSARPATTATRNASQGTAASVPSSAAPACPPAGEVAWYTETFDAQVKVSVPNVAPLYEVNASGRIENRTRVAVMVYNTSLEIYDAQHRRGTSATIMLIDRFGNSIPASTAIQPGETARWVVRSPTSIQQPDGTIGGAPTRIAPAASAFAALMSSSPCFLTAAIN